jgi:PAS domain-containing protein
VRRLDGVARCVEGIAFPLIGQGDRMLGAVGIFWDPQAPPAPGTPHVGRAVDLASPGGDRPVELLLMRQLASYLRTSIFLMGPDGTLLYFNESSEALLGRRFDETEPMNAEQWSTLLQSEDERGAPIEIDARPIVVALRRQQPSHRTFSIRRACAEPGPASASEARSSPRTPASPTMRDVTERPLPELRV